MELEEGCRRGDSGHPSNACLGEGQTCLLPPIVQQLGEFLHDLLRRLHGGGGLSSEQVAGPRVRHRPVLVGQVDEVGHGGLPLVLLRLPAVLHQQLSYVRAHHGLQGKGVIVGENPLVLRQAAQAAEGRLQALGLRTGGHSCTHKAVPPRITVLQTSTS